MASHLQIACHSFDLKTQNEKPQYKRKLCQHNKRKSRCIECGGSEICEHIQRKSQCVQCGGSGICEHNKRKSRCVECNGREICQHKKRKSRCNECGGSETCKNSWCDTKRNYKYEGYCYTCFVSNPLFKDREIVKNYKNKERAVVDYVMNLQESDSLTWVHDKPVDGGCSKRRPDLLLDMGTHIIIIEIDENQHSDYNTTCELVRNNNLWQDVHFRPIVFIRFNPDKYRVGKETFKSCWKITKRGLCAIDETQKKNWILRLELLKTKLLYWLKNIPLEQLTIEYLFYDVS